MERHELEATVRGRPARAFHPRHGLRLGARPSGDGAEYLLQARALSTHASPEVREEDARWLAARVPAFRRTAHRLLVGLRAGDGTPVAAIRREGTGHIVLFERNSWGGISTTRQQAPNDVFILQWDLRDGLVVEYPAAATDMLGRVVVMMKGSDGKLYFQREASADAMGGYGGWMLAGK